MTQYINNCKLRIDISPRCKWEFFLRKIFRTAISLAAAEMLKQILHYKWKFCLAINSATNYFLAAAIIYKRYVQCEWDLFWKKILRRWFLGWCRVTPTKPTLYIKAIFEKMFGRLFFLAGVVIWLLHSDCKWEFLREKDLA